MSDMETINGTEISYDYVKIQTKLKNISNDYADEETYLILVIIFAILSGISLLLFVVMYVKKVQSSPMMAKGVSIVVIILAATLGIGCIYAGIFYDYNTDRNALQKRTVDGINGIVHPNLNDVCNYLAIKHTCEIRSHLNNAINEFYTTYFGYTLNQKTNNDVNDKLTKINNILTPFIGTKFFELEALNHKHGTSLTSVTLSIILVLVCAALFKTGHWKAAIVTCLVFLGFVIIPYSVMRGKKNNYVANANYLVESLKDLNQPSSWWWAWWTPPPSVYKTRNANYKNKIDTFVKKQPFSRTRVSDEFVQYTQVFALIIIAISVITILSIGYAYVTHNDEMGKTLNWVSFLSFLLALVIVPTLITILSVAYS